MYRINIFVEMPVKDYYTLLKIEPNADLSTIKKAYRKLAMQYHPDKTGNNEYTESYFREIQEAYLTLSDTRKREEYLYNRWLEKSMGHSLDTALTPIQIIQLFLKTEQYIHGTDEFKMDKYHLLEHLKQLYSIGRQEIIISSNDEQLEKESLRLAMQSSKLLPSEAQLNFQNHLQMLLSKHPYINKEWNETVHRISKKERLDFYKIPIVILITILICLAILLISK
jgi:curved DNA-binding protein CbpA